MGIPFQVEFEIPYLFGGTQHTLHLHNGFTQIVGPNGSGKSQLLRTLKNQLQRKVEGKVRLMSSSRLHPLGSSRSITHKNRSRPQYDNATLGRRNKVEGGEHKVETIVGDVHRLKNRTDLQAKVRERLKTWFNKNIHFRWGANGLEVSFSKTNTDDPSSYSSAREASGLLHLVATLTAIYDADIDLR